MKNSHLTIRLSGDLARALSRVAKARGVTKSQVAREAVSRCVAPSPASATPAPRLTAGQLALRWAGIPALDPDEATAFGVDLAAARTELPATTLPWG